MVSPVSAYRVIRQLGAGGMARVFLAELQGAAGFTRTVVLKRLDPAVAREPDAVTLFLDEARIAAQLHHHNICQVFDFGEDVGGFYLAMEYLDGVDTRTLLRATPNGLALAAVAAIGHGAAAGLGYAHQCTRDGQPLAIVHRDVTTGNVFVTRAGAVKIIDFGIARAAHRTTRTRTGLVRGTVAYMSPEQVQGHALDHRSDLFSLGIVLYELISGLRPFDKPGDADLVVMRRVETGVHVPIGQHREDCPAALERLIERMLEVDPGLRPQSAEVIAAELEAIGAEHGWPMSAAALAAAVQHHCPLDGSRPEPPAAPPLRNHDTEVLSPLSPPVAGLEAAVPSSEAPTVAEQPRREQRARRSGLRPLAMLALVAVAGGASYAVLREPRSPGHRSGIEVPDAARHDGPVVVHDHWPLALDAAAPPTLDAGVITSSTASDDCIGEARDELATATQWLETDHVYDARIQVERARGYLGGLSVYMFAEDCRRARVAEHVGFGQVMSELLRVEERLVAAETVKDLVFRRHESGAVVIYVDRTTDEELMPEHARAR